jgi:hypothetical protein
MNPVLALLATRPQLLVDHAQAYGALINQEFSLARTRWCRQLLLYAATLCCLSVAAVLAGVTALLVVNIAPLWLWAVPAVPLLLAAVCLLLARRTPHAPSFANLRRQLDEDLAMLRTAGEP